MCILLQNGVYEDLFVGALKHLGLLSIGLYRQIDPRPSVGSYNRYVIANPPPDFSLFPSDKVSDQLSSKCLLHSTMHIFINM